MAFGHIIIIIGTSSEGRLRRSIPKPRRLTLHKIAHQAYSTLSWLGLRLPMTFSGRQTIPPGRSATKAFSIRPLPNIPPSVSPTCAPGGIGKGDAALRLGREIAPTAAQQPLLEKLGTALAQANGYLIKSCPAEIPPLPAERLQLMESQIDAMTMALEIVRVPLQKFEQSLDDRQRRLLSARVASEDVKPVSRKARSQPTGPCRFSSRPCNLPPVNRRH